MPGAIVLPGTAAWGQRGGCQSNRIPRHQLLLLAGQVAAGQVGEAREPLGSHVAMGGLAGFRGCGKHPRLVIPQRGVAFQPWRWDRLEGR